MIFVLTVHWKDPKWISIQDEYLKRYLLEPYKKIGYLNYINSEYKRFFDVAKDDEIESHAIKLNLLADIAIEDSTSGSDILIFLDGDAFPIKELGPLIEKIRGDEYQLAAVQRLENNGDIQPHPCFCVTTVDCWKSINGDWEGGYTWLNKAGDEITDVGGNLKQKLDSAGIDWKRLLRSNKYDRHPLWYGVYGELVYHHGAGFRAPVSRLDYPILRKYAKCFLRTQTGAYFRKLFLSKFLKTDRGLAKVMKESEQIYNAICTEADFFQTFDEYIRDMGDI